MEGPRD